MIFDYQYEKVHVIYFEYLENKFNLGQYKCVYALQFGCILENVGIQAYLGDIVRLAPDHHNKVNIMKKQVIQLFWFPSAYKNYVYTTL